MSIKSSNYQGDTKQRVEAYRSNNLSKKENWILAEKQRIVGIKTSPVNFNELTTKFLKEAIAGFLIASPFLVFYLKL